MINDDVSYEFNALINPSNLKKYSTKRIINPEKHTKPYKCITISNSHLYNL